MGFIKEKKHMELSLRFLELVLRLSNTPLDNVDGRK